MSGRVEGKIVAYSPAGDLLTDIAGQQLASAPRDESVRIVCDEHETIGIFGPDHGEPEATFLALLPPGGPLELRVVGMSARELLGIRLGDKVVVEWP